jgi:hypothetical protein
MLELWKEENPSYEHAMRARVRAGEVKAVVALEEMMSLVKTSAPFDPDLAIMSAAAQERDSNLSTFHNPDWSIFSYNGQEIAKYSSNPNWIRDAEDWIISNKANEIRHAEAKQSGVGDFFGGLFTGERQKDWTSAYMSKAPVYTGPLSADSELFNPVANLRGIERKALNPANPQHAMVLAMTPEQRQAAGVYLKDFDEDVLARNFVPRQPRTFNEATAIGFREGITDARNPGVLKRLQLEQAREHARRISRASEEAKDMYRGAIGHLSTQIEDPVAVAARKWTNQGVTVRNAIADIAEAAKSALTSPTAKKALGLGALGYAGYKILNRDPNSRQLNAIRRTEPGMTINLGTSTLPSATYPAVSD